MTLGDEEESSFQVKDPIKGSHVTYSVKGIDNDGVFEGQRRYNDFYYLRMTLQSRWPGIFIPPIPPKKSFGNKKTDFVRDRMVFLERFLKIVSKNYFLLNSEEFKIFSRPRGDQAESIENALKHLAKPTPDSILERLRLTFNIGEEPDTSRLQNCRTEINDFKAFITKVTPILKTMQMQTKEMVPNKDS